MTELNHYSSENKRPKVKMMLPAVVLVTSFYYSLSFTGGVIIGYLLCKVFCTAFVHNGKIDGIFLDFGKWEIHLHHWIIGIVLLGIIWVIDRYYLPTFLLGIISGIIIQDIYDYNDWYKVITKKEETATN
ncbi:MAG: hypothetical protein A3D44_03795 [Candidatus Staskawiczbacteria bacterium RIFCSPHIGHO2_02_FULL_42_22]|uniref:Uncharacterized protein n=1 Tax=Candidatus Staskawiczbacteria bacterium RIFCSPHIGHO2_02_FULL_42_22 TaxID=1802207 RepID=A0A1G2I4U7_9BACT|nr:MAG: hypothetical protein A3D44_03795 [Candidatus Staskawiczbacteria bacterium RIFCSPHIGHO2_02_FULL_42_22]